MTNENPTEIQMSVEGDDIPQSEQIIRWVNQVLSQEQRFGELVIRFVSTQESQKLNQAFRQKDAPTNVLAFPSEIPAEIQAHHPVLGDIVICPEVVAKEALAYEKSTLSHYAHMVIHGLLHIVGYDHQSLNEQKIMEQKEIHYLNQLGFTNPYEVNQHHV